MRAFIIEDEPIAQWILEGLLKEVVPWIEICGKAGTVEDAVAWLGNPANSADVVFMDVELADGNCFDILEEIAVPGHIVMTTAYDHYAVRAFDVGSVDYLLKPIETDALRRALARCIAGEASDADSVLQALYKSGMGGKSSSLKRFLVPVGDKIYPIKIENIAYFFSDGSGTFLMTDAGLRYVLSDTLHTVGDKVGGDRFFRVSRNFIVSRESIASVCPLPGSRYKLALRPDPPFEVIVSRRRAQDFNMWRDGSYSPS